MKADGEAVESVLHARRLRPSAATTPSLRLRAIKAALEAWGVHANLFAEGVAGLEPDPEWRKKALASPDEVFRKPRGDPAALLAKARA